jgi:ribosomal protein S18 acetylase RimI-like enzyme
VLIRRAETRDSPGLARVQVDSYRTAYAGIFSRGYLDQFSYEEQAQDWRDWILDRPEDDLYVAALPGGEIVAYALARAGPTEVPPYDGELLALHVRSSHRRQGLGRQLVAAVAEQLWQRGSRSLLLWVLEANRSRGFYERLGAQLLEARKITGGQPEVAYGWPDIESLLP